MQNLNYPLELEFKISTLANDFRASDADGNLLAYVRQKMFKFKEEIQVYADESRTEEMFRINANKWLDFNTAYTFTAADGSNVGRITRKGWASLWKAHYEILDEKDLPDLVLREKNAWVKVLDGLLSEIPILGMFTGYLCNPSYIITRSDGTEVVILKKQPSFFGRKFSIIKLDEFEAGEDARIVLGCMMMVLLERRRG
jgi:hypothetical protein